MAPRTGVRLIFSRSARSASSIHVPGDKRPCTISSRISRNAVIRLVPCSGFCRGFFVDVAFFLVVIIEIAIIARSKRKTVYKKQEESCTKESREHQYNQVPLTRRRQEAHFLPAACRCAGAETSTPEP